jgi:putative ABC transport system substrate-binding protein
MRGWYTAATSVTSAAKRATVHTPIVFFAGTDPVAAGLVQSLAKPGGRLTGVHGLSTDLTAKRLEILKEMLPSLGRVVTSITLATRSRGRGPGWAARPRGSWAGSSSSDT